MKEAKGHGPPAAPKHTDATRVQTADYLPLCQPFPIIRFLPASVLGRQTSAMGSWKNPKVCSGLGEGFELSTLGND
jgi:hypothetical protein